MKKVKRIPAYISGCCNFKANIHTIINNFRQRVFTGQNEQVREVVCALKRDWMKSVLSMNIFLNNIVDTFHRRPEFKVTSFKCLVHSFSKKKVT
jgi:hypothetical protein